MKFHPYLSAPFGGKECNNLETEMQICEQIKAEGLECKNQADSFPFNHKTVMRLMHTVWLSLSKQSVLNTHPNCLISFAILSLRI